MNAGGLGAPVLPLGAEVVVVAGIGAGILLLYQRRAAFDEEMLHMLLGALGSYLAAEVCFALTVDALVPLSLAGHLLRLLAFYLFARAIVEFGVRRPYSVLFRELSSRTDEHSARHGNTSRGCSSRLPAQSSSSMPKAGSPA